jgi:hypothetical protein
MTLVKIVKYLEQSSSPLTRRRGRAALRKAVAALLKKYPPIDKNGKERRAAKKPTCPLCKAPMRWNALAWHLCKHLGNGYDARKCPCCSHTFKSHRGLIKHLQSLRQNGELKTHVVMAATARAFGAESSTTNWMWLTT